MLKKRLISVLILRDGRVVQSVRFKHTNVIHYDPVHAMEAFNAWAVDEIIILNVSPDEQSREQFAQTVANISTHCFIPVTAGGWITDESYAERLLHSGADKIIVNSILHSDPGLVQRLSLRYGKQCIVASIDSRQTAESDSVVINRGRDDIQQHPVSWAQHAVTLGAGEIFYNSVNHDGARRGYNLPVLQQICQHVPVPVIAFGGVFRWPHLIQGLDAGAAAVAVANQFHYTEHAARKAKKYLAEQGIPVRKEGQTAITAEKRL